MRVGVIGGGTAGFMAAAAVTRRCPGEELVHVFDPAIPTIGVGEGTLGNFPGWLYDVTRLPEARLRDLCGVTRKYGVTFEGWGRDGGEFTHSFYPIGRKFGYHISAPTIVEQLAPQVGGTRLAKNVERLESDGRATTIRFSDGEELRCDIVLDARGFPRRGEDDDVVPLPIVPTNAALVHRGQPVEGLVATRSVARPHGWVFIIPLTTSTAYGYVYNGDLSTLDEVNDDLERLFAEEGATPSGEARGLRFPNFTRRRFFDGSLFAIGNRASFLEPLEATAIGFTQAQLEAACRWPLGAWLALPMSEETRRRNIETLNRFLFHHSLKMALFIGWHYSAGARYRTPFWDFAAANYRRHREDFPAPIIEEFEGFLRRGARFSSVDELAHVALDDRSEHHGQFAFWPLESFVQMTAGLRGPLRDRELEAAR